MRMNRILVLVIAGLVGSLPAFAAEYPIDIKTDLKGQYFVVEKGGTTDNPIVVVKRVWPKGTYFTKRWFDCKNWTVKYLGEGETLKAMNKAAPDLDSTAIEEGSIPDQLARHVCPK